MTDKYWLDEIEEAFKLGRNSGTRYDMNAFMKRIHDDLDDEKAHHYATKEILQEIAEQIAIELTNIQEAKDEKIIVKRNSLKNQIIEYLSFAAEIDRDELYGAFPDTQRANIKAVMRELIQSGIVDVTTDKYTNRTLTIYHLNKDKL